MRAASLFSGIGAPEVAMPGWQWLWHAEIEKFPSAVMAARHPESVNLGDVTADDFVERALAIGRPDVVVFGSPCQSYSVAGQRLGLADPRGNLALIALGILARIKPRWFIFENVPGLLSSRSSDLWDFGVFLGAVQDLGCGGAWAMLDAQFFGLAQRRDRIFVVGHARDWRRAAAVLLEPESLCGHPPTRGQAGQDVTGTLSSRPSAGGGLGTDFDLAGGVMAWPADLAVCDPNQMTSKANRSVPSPELSHPLPGQPNSPIAFSVAASIGQRMRGQDDGCADNLQTTQLGVRRLMPVECERLQGFPDSYTAITYRGKPAADGPRYKAIGNSMAVPVVRWILERLEAVDAIQAESERVA